LLACAEPTAERGPGRRARPDRRAASGTGKSFRPAAPAQRAKVAGRECLVCGWRPADPAHLVPRSPGGCDHPDCVVPLCRTHHRRYDRGQLDLLSHLEPRYGPSSPTGSCTWACSGCCGAM
jgi:HNH endonuclease